MKSQKTYPALNFEQLYDGYSKSLDNALCLLDSGLKLWNQHTSTALGLSELGQEELGKSLSFFSAFHLLSQEVVDWSWFWGAWRDHQLKAHRAFLYELVSPTRMIIRAHGKNELTGISIRSKIKHEKEAAFYVEYDANRKEFISPEQDITSVELANRCGTLLCLASTALTLKKTLDEEGDKEQNYICFSEIAFRICSENIYQQQMPDILDAFASRSVFHEKLIARLRENLSKNEKAMTGLNASSCPAG